MRWASSHIVIVLMLLVSSLQARAADSIGDRIERSKREAAKDASQRIQAVLERYCTQHCQLLDIQVEVHETFADSDDLGFESAENAAESHLEVQTIRPVVQIDSRVLSSDRDRLEALIRNKIKPLAPEVTLSWETVDLPSIGSQSTSADELEMALEGRLRRSIQGVIDRYCPDQCLLDRIDIDSVVATPNQMQNLPSEQIIRGKRSEGGLQVNEIRVQLTLDEALADADRERIIRLMQAQTRYVQPVVYAPTVTGFPETAADKKRKAQEESTDPYGLEKLRQMLILFRDLASTKELITTQTSELKSSSEQNNRSESSNERSEQKINESKLESNSNSNSNNSSSQTSEQNSTESSRRTDVNSMQSAISNMSMEEMAIYAGGFILLLTLMAIVLMKFSQTNRAAREMVMASSGGGGGYAPARVARSAPPSDMSGGMGEMGSGESGGGQGGGAPAGVDGYGNHNHKQAMLILKVAQLKQEMIQQFLEQRSVARETFTRLLKDEGVAETAKYVAIFGQLIVSELLNDSSLKRDLYELSEYFHRSNLKFDAAGELALLERLKTMVTASEIRLLANQSSERFGFLNKLDSQQIYNLIVDETPRVQSIVLTQLDRKKRTTVFELYEGDAKIMLLEELSHAEAIPREFLFNVAQALQKKVTTRSEFDTENLRSSDILLDLLERANLREQKRLMRTLEKNNPETARALKLKLVTVEMIPYLKDGHLLEVVLGMERDDLLAFLMGADEHIRDLLLRKAPEELAQSWIEDIRNLGGSGLDDNTFRTAEMKIKARIRNLANNGAISLLDINDLIFKSGSDEGDPGPENSRTLSRGAFAA